MPQDSTRHSPPDERPTGQSIRRGLACRCPACGQGRLFTSYLKVTKACPTCGEELHHQRADDGPAYLTMLVVCHVAGILLHELNARSALSPLQIALVTCAAVIPLCLLLLPRAKGFMVAIQWAKRMHGFAPAIAAQP